MERAEFEQFIQDAGLRASWNTESSDGQSLKWVVTLEGHRFEHVSLDAAFERAAHWWVHSPVEKSVKRIQDLNDIDLATDEGKLLLAALAILTTTPELTILKQTVNGRQCTPWDMIEHLQRAAAVMDFKDDGGTAIAKEWANANGFEKMKAAGDELQSTLKPEHGNAPRLEQELATALNRVSAENESHTPDFILAEYLINCLNAFDRASNRREKWYGKGLRIGGMVELGETGETASTPTTSPSRFSIQVFRKDAPDPYNSSPEGNAIEVKNWYYNAINKFSKSHYEVKIFDISKGVFIDIEELKSHINPSANVGNESTL